MKRDYLVDLILAAFIFVSVFLSHFNSGNNFSFDSRWTIPTALSLIREGNTDLDEYREFVVQLDEYGAVETFGGHIYTNFPIGPSLVAVPFVFVIDQLARYIWSFDLNAYVSQTIPAAIELFVASIVVALTAVVMYRIARLFLSRPYSLFVVFVFAFCTSAWSTASRALWQHGPSMLMLALTLYILLRARETPRLSQYAALPLALAYVMRPGNSIAVALLTIYVFLQHRRYFVRYLLWAMVVAVPFVAYNWSIYHALVPPYYTLYQSSAAGAFLEGLVGTLLSPSRGLFVFSPILLLSIVGVVEAVRQRSFERLDAFIVVILILNWIISSLWPIWWGGWSFGPRLLSDTIPYWIYLMIPAVAAFADLNQTRQAILACAALILTGLSFFIHYRGANAPEVIQDWSLHPVNIDSAPARLWDWRDIQFLRGITWGAPMDVSTSGVSIKQLAPEAYTRIGTNDLRTRRFEAATSLIAPPGESWVLLAENQSPGPELSAFFAGALPQFHAQTIGDRTAYRAYHFDLGARIMEAARQAEHEAWWSLDLYPDPANAHPASLPVSFGRTVDLIGFRVIGDPSSNRVRVMTYWRAGDVNVDPLLIFVHALGAQGQIVAQDDRLGAPTKHWQSGDLIVQVNRLDIPPAAGPIWIEIGLYNPESGERLPVLDGEREVDRRLLLKTIQTE